jgi:hypothetical protein
MTAKRFNYLLLAIIFITIAVMVVVKWGLIR